MRKRKTRHAARRMAQEAKTFEVMIHRYCRDKYYNLEELCPECRKRLSLCPYQEYKTTCGICPVHCYKPAMRPKVQQVMRYVGPRMPWSNPVLSFQHCLDGFRREPLGRIKGKGEYSAKTYLQFCESFSIA